MLARSSLEFRNLRKTDFKGGAELAMAPAKTFGCFIRQNKDKTGKIEKIKQLLLVWLFFRVTSSIRSTKCNYWRSFGIPTLLQPNTNG